MIRGIDHLVIACPDPDEAATELEAQVGLTAAGGGRHSGLGTWNRIVWLADGSYLELIGVEDREAATTSPVGRAVLAALDGPGAGLATWAVRDDAVEATADGLRAAGARISAVGHGSRQRADGEVVEWWAAFPEGAPLGADAPPFLIQHAEVGTEWGPAAQAERRTFRHPIGSPAALARLDLATDDPRTAAATFHAQLGLDFWAVSDLAVAEIGSHVVRLRPRREMPVPAVVTVAADVPAPQTVELLGLRFDVERAELPVPAR